MDGGCRSMQYNEGGWLMMEKEWWRLNWLVEERKRNKKTQQTPKPHEGYS
jgi:hypothetical protein